MITKRPFRAHLAWLHITFQNEINVCRHLQVDRFAANQLDRFPSQESGKQQFVQTVRQRRSGRECVNRVAAKCNSYRHALTAFVVAFAVPRTDFVNLPMHSSGALVIDLHPVNADVARTGLRVARMHIWQGDETPAVFWPAFEDGEIAQRKAAATVALIHHFLARCVTHRFRSRVEQMNSLLQ